LKWLGIPRPDEIPYKLTEAEKKLVSPWRIQDFSAIDYLKNLNYTAYLKDRKLISQEPKIIESKKGNIKLEVIVFRSLILKCKFLEKITKKIIHKAIPRYVICSLPIVRNRNMIEISK
jgi:hypothetical protein